MIVIVIENIKCTVYQILHTTATQTTSPNRLPGIFLSLQLLHDVSGDESNDRFGASPPVIVSDRFCAEKVIGFVE